MGFSPKDDKDKFGKPFEWHRCICRECPVKVFVFVFVFAFVFVFTFVYVYVYVFVYLQTVGMFS